MVTLEAIPEPETWVLIGLGLAVVLVRLRFSQCARTAIVGKDNLSRIPTIQPTPHSARRCGVFFWCEAVGIRLASLAAKVLAAAVVVSGFPTVSQGLDFALSELRNHCGFCYAGFHFVCCPGFAAFHRWQDRRKDIIKFLGNHEIAGEAHVTE
jgi:hypothetical protein